MHIRQIDQFNIVIVGTGGQGLITLLQIIAEAALASGFDVKTSELHGLSQRGGSVEVHIRFGKKVTKEIGENNAKETDPRSKNEQICESVERCTDLVQKCNGQRQTSGGKR